MTTTNPLSPAAQAVLDAYSTHADLLNREVSYEEMLAAALRAAADQVVPGDDGYKSGEVFLVAMNVRFKLLAIAKELQGNR